MNRKLVGLVILASLMIAPDVLSQSNPIVSWLAIRVEVVFETLAKYKEKGYAAAPATYCVDIIGLEVGAAIVEALEHSSMLNSEDRRRLEDLSKYLAKLRKCCEDLNTFPPGSADPPLPPPFPNIPSDLENLIDRSW